MAEAKRIRPVLMKVAERQMSAEVIFMTVKTIIKAGLEKEFVAACAAENRTMTITKDDMDFIKKFVASFYNRELRTDDPKGLTPSVMRIAKSQPQC